VEITTQFEPSPQSISYIKKFIIFTIDIKVWMHSHCTGFLCIHKSCNHVRPSRCQTHIPCTSGWDNLEDNSYVIFTVYQKRFKYTGETFVLVDAYIVRIAHQLSFTLVARFAQLSIGSLCMEISWMSIILEIIPRGTRQGSSAQAPQIWQPFSSNSNPNPQAAKVWQFWDVSLSHPRELSGTLISDF
jgi:hypothetical protein